MYEQITAVACLHGQRALAMSRRTMTYSSTGRAATSSATATAREGEKSNEEFHKLGASLMLVMLCFA